MDRALTKDEERLVRWMLEHGSPDAGDFLPQLARVRVAATCPCGCASLDFSVDGRMPDPGKIRILADFLIGSSEASCGAFVFERAGLLAGLEIYAGHGLAPPDLPAPEELRPYDDA